MDSLLHATVLTPEPTVDWLSRVLDDGQAFPNRQEKGCQRTFLKCGQIPKEPVCKTWTKKRMAGSLYLAHEDKFVVTPVGCVFEMYVPHQGNQALRAMTAEPRVSYDRDDTSATFWALQGSASLPNRERVLTVVNPHIEEPRLTEIKIRGATGRRGTVSTLTHSDIRAHNAFDQPNALVPKANNIGVEGSTSVQESPPASVSALCIELA